MKIDDVPQDRGMITDDRREVCYAVDDDGRYVMTGSAGWEPKNIANHQAWQLIDIAATRALERVHGGKVSPLAYHMANHQMSVGLLAKYASTSRFKVWLHLRPGPFAKMTDAQLKHYADAFGIAVDELKAVPDTHVSRSGNPD
jgi:hypothetical protein